MIDKIVQFAGKSGAGLKEDNGVYTLKIRIAERKAFLSRKTLEYIAKFRIHEERKEIAFTEMLKESGAGLSMGDIDDPAPGFGFKATTYKTGFGPREGTIEERSDLFGKKYEYKFDFKTVRTKLEDIARSAGYKFRYHITSIGLNKC